MPLKTDWIAGNSFTAADQNAVAGAVNLIQYSVKDAAYGATGNGSTDDTTAIQNAVTAAAAANVGLYFPPGTYKVSSTINLTTNSKLVLHPAAVVDGTTVATQTPILQALGTVSTTSNLSANVAEQALSCTVVSGTGFAAGDYVRLESTASTGSDGILSGEILRILSVATNTITFQSYTKDAYTTATTAKITKLTLVDGVEITGGTIQGQVTAATALSVGVRFRLCVNARITNTRFRYCHMNGVSNWESIFTRVTNCDFYFCENDNFGYAVVHDGAAQDAVVTGCSFTRCKTAVDHTGSTGTGGVARRCIFAHNTIVAAYRAGMQSHTGAEELVFAFNTIDTTIQDPLYGAGQCDGMNVFGNRMIIVGNTFRGMNRRMIYTGSNGTSKPFEVVISNNRCRGSSLEVNYGAGIEMDMSAGTVESVIITGNDLNMNTAQNCYGAVRIIGPGSGTVGGFIITDNKFTGPTQYPAIMANNIKDFTISDNRLICLGNSSNSFGVQVDNSIDGAISGNVIVGSGSGTATFGISAANTTDVTVTGNRIKGFFNGVKTTGTSNFWAVAANSLRGFVSGGATTSLVGANNATTGANV